jgi:hypothetical protein
MDRRIGMAFDRMDTGQVMSARRNVSFAVMAHRNAPTMAKFIALYSTQLDLLIALNQQLQDVLQADPPPSGEVKIMLRNQCHDLASEIDAMKRYVDMLVKFKSFDIQMNQVQSVHS